MPTIKPAEVAWPRRRLLLLAVGLLAVAGVALVISLGRPPQMGADEEVFHSVDALFTAVTAHDRKLLDQCERRLHSLKDAGKIPVAASTFLDGVIQNARVERWQPAAETLYNFMKSQRREGAYQAKSKDARRRESGKKATN